ncbi:MAG: SpoIVB peptidase [Clostridia bacterium]|nr:SpoIVB peptidase [Clostridia bacterium]
MSTIVLKNLPKQFAKIGFILCTCLLILGVLAANRLPERLYTSSPKEISLSFPIPMVAKPAPLLSADGQQPENGYQASIQLFGIIPIGSAKVKIADTDTVVLGGNPFGIKILSDGVLVVGFNDVETPNGKVNPAKQAGLKEGDLILTVNNKTLTTNTELVKLVEGSNGKSLTIRAQRDAKRFTVTVIPQKSTDGHYRAGMWVRDSTAGLGTMTFYHPESGMYGGLGHGVCDADTGQIMSLAQGEIVGAQINGLHKATAGKAGELRGSLVDNLQLGSILRNCKNGVYGHLYEPPQSGQVLRVARKQEVKKGAATLYTCVNGTVQPYACTIQRVNLKERADHHMVIRVSDPELLSKTGGILQGMSGSPIVQNGKLVGAITHVFLNQPEKGYGIFAENMLETVQSVANRQVKEAG